MTMLSLVAAVCMATGTARAAFVDVSSGSGLAATQLAVAGWFDYENDGALELLVSDANGTRGYRRVSGNAFTVFYAHSAVAEAISFGDYDNDGRVDVFLTVSAGQNVLLRNVGGNTFQSMPVAGTALSNPAANRDAAWGDATNDGRLDLFIGDHGVGCCLAKSKLVMSGGQIPGAAAGEFSWTAYDSPPFDLFSRPVISVTWINYDRDQSRTPDIMASGGPPIPGNVLLRNRNSSIPPGLPDFVETSVVPTTGNQNGKLTWGDYNGDQYPDLFFANVIDGSKLYRNVADPNVPGGRNFVLVTGSGIGFSQGHASEWIDFDNDGDLDLYTAGSLYRNNSFGASFTDVTVAQGLNFLSGQTMAWGDYDGDGDLDLFATEGGGARLMRNDSDPANRYLKIRLRGAISNASGIGAEVRVAATSGNMRVRQVLGGTGNGAGNNLEVHTGLGTGGAWFIEVYWPSGIYQLKEFTLPASNQTLTLVEPVLQSLTSNIAPGSFIATCPGGDAQSYTVTVDLAPSNRAVRADEIVLEVPSQPPFFWKNGSAIDAIPATGEANFNNGWTTEIKHSRMSACAMGYFNVRVNSVVVGLVYYRFLSFDMVPASTGFVDGGDLAAFAAAKGKCEGQPGYNACTNWFVNPPPQQQCTDASDQDLFAAHYGHNKNSPGGGAVAAPGKEDGDPRPGALAGNSGRARLIGSSPNPLFGSGRSTVIRYALAGPSHVRLSVFDIAGRLVRELVNGEQSGIDHAVSWDGRDDSGQPVASGVYYCRFRAGATDATLRLAVSH